MVCTQLGMHPGLVAETLENFQSFLVGFAKRQFVFRIGCAHLWVAVKEQNLNYHDRDVHSK